MLGPGLEALWPQGQSAHPAQEETPAPARPSLPCVPCAECHRVQLSCPGGLPGLRHVHRCYHLLQHLHKPPILPQRPGLLGREGVSLQQLRGQRLPGQDLVGHDDRGAVDEEPGAALPCRPRHEGGRRSCALLGSARPACRLEGRRHAPAGRKALHAAGRRWPGSAQAVRCALARALALSPHADLASAPIYKSSSCAHTGRPCTAGHHTLLPWRGSAHGWAPPIARPSQTCAQQIDYTSLRA